MLRTGEFGSFVRKRRIELGMTLRRLSRKTGQDVGNLSRIERGKLAPPKPERKLKRLADALEISDEEALREFYDLAHVSRGEVPTDILSDKELAGKLPLVFRTMRGDKLSRKKLTELAEVIRES